MSKADFKSLYDTNDHKREDLGAPNEVLRVVRGCSFVNYQRDTCCGNRYWNYPDNWSHVGGFRVVACQF